MFVSSSSPPPEVAAGSVWPIHRQGPGSPPVGFSVAVCVAPLVAKTTCVDQSATANSVSEKTKLGCRATRTRQLSMPQVVVDPAPEAAAVLERKNPN